ncbi:MAG: GerMN domain-containing protein [Chloroflexi bacterium]|nr:GerMN domain-containing protein [Chloroflexota bacterium]
MACDQRPAATPIPGSDVAVAAATPPAGNVTVKVYFFNGVNFSAGTPPFVTPVERDVDAVEPMISALKSLLLGPTPEEEAQGLRLVASGATGIAEITLRDGIARVRLAGNCETNGSVFTIAQEIIPTVKQFPGVQYVKILNAAGETEDPDGASNSIPVCLEP